MIRIHHTRTASKVIDMAMADAPDERHALENEGYAVPLAEVELVKTDEGWIFGWAFMHSSGSMTGHVTAPNKALGVYPSRRAALQAAYQRLARRQQRTLSSGHRSLVSDKQRRQARKIMEWAYELAHQPTLFDA